MRRGDTAVDFWLFTVSFHEARSKACTKEGPVGFVKNLDLIWNKEKECPNWPSADRKCVLSGPVAASPVLSEEQVVCSDVLGLGPKGRAARQRHFSQKPLEGAQSKLDSRIGSDTRSGHPFPTHSCSDFSGSGGGRSHGMKMLVLRKGPLTEPLPVPFLRSYNKQWLSSRLCQDQC